MTHQIIPVAVTMVVVGGWAVISYFWHRAVKRKHREEIARVIEQTRREERSPAKALANAELIIPAVDLDVWADRAIAITRGHQPADVTTN